MARILIVDDTKLIRVMLRDLLEQAGHVVAEAEDGAAGLDSFRQFRPAVVITDIVMPGLGGVGLVAAIRKECPEARVIAISGGSQGTKPSFLATVRTFPGVRTLAKSFRPFELLAEVDALLGARRPPS